MSFPEFAGIILRHGSHYFLLERSNHSRHWPHHWGFPGGKKEPDETLFEAAAREMLEETGVSVEEKNVVETISIRAHYIDGIRANTLFLLDTWEGTPENLEPDIHDDIGWFTLDDLPSPMIAHVRAGLFALLEGEKEITYDGL